MTKRSDSIQMSVAGVGVDPTTQTPAVILKDFDNKMILPIWINQLEATSIVVAVEKAKMSRPLTHDLLVDMLHELGGALESVELSELKDETCYALLHLRFEDQPLAVDCQPGDAITLAVKNDVPIYVRKAIVEACGEMSPQVEEGGEEDYHDFSASSEEEMVELLRKMSRKDFRYKT